MTNLLFNNKINSDTRAALIVFFIKVNDLIIADFFECKIIPLISWVLCMTGKLNQISNRNRNSHLVLIGLNNEKYIHFL